MNKHAESHLDHNLTPMQIDHVMQRFADRDAFFIETIELPDELGTVPCGLHGPLVGEPPVSEEHVSYAKRGTREWKSRLVEEPPSRVRTVTVIAGPHEEQCQSTHVPQHGHQLRMGGCNGTGKIERAGMHAGAAWHEETCPKCDGTGKIQHACIVYTMYGGPLAPQEPADIRAQIQTLERSRRAYHPELNLTDEQEAEIHAKILALRSKRDEADTFWAQHALSKI